MLMRLFFLTTFVEATGSLQCSSSSSAFFRTLNYCYWLVNVPKTFSEAESECVNQGGHLAKIPNENALRFIQDELSSVIKNYGAWIGIKTPDYSNFIFIDGSSVSYLPWEDKFMFKGQCVVLKSDKTPYSYYDHSCLDYKQFLCYAEMVITTSNEYMTTTKRITKETTNTKTIALAVTDVTTSAEIPTFATTDEAINTEVPTLAITDVTMLTSTKDTTISTISSKRTTSSTKRDTEATTATNIISTIGAATASQTSTLIHESSTTNRIFKPDPETTFVTTTQHTVHVSTGENATCLCVCYGNPSISKKALQTRLDELVAILTIPKKATSASLRKLISAPDDRTSAKGIGYFGAFILISVVGLVLLSDIVNMFFFKQKS